MYNWYYKKKAVSSESSKWQFMGQFENSQSSTSEMLFDIRQAARGNDVSFKIDAKNVYSKDAGGYLVKFIVYYQQKH